MTNITVFASHSGSNLQAIINASEKCEINARVVAVISNNSNAYALERARKANVPAYHISSIKKNSGQLTLDVLEKHGTDIIFLAGYLKKIDERILELFKNKIFNIHPSLLPKYGGKGMFGLNVHEAVIKNNETKTGATVHKVTSEYDQGEILEQVSVPVDTNDPKVLQAKVLEIEHQLVVSFLKKFQG